MTSEARLDRLARALIPPDRTGAIREARHLWGVMDRWATGGTAAPLPRCCDEDLTAQLARGSGPGLASVDAWLSHPEHGAEPSPPDDLDTARTESVRSDFPAVSPPAAAVSEVAIANPPEPASTPRPHPANGESESKPKEEIREAPPSYPIGLGDGWQLVNDRYVEDPWHTRRLVSKHLRQDEPEVYERALRALRGA